MRGDVLDQKPNPLSSIPPESSWKTNVFVDYPFIGAIGGSSTTFSVQIDSLGATLCKTTAYGRADVEEVGAVLRLTVVLRDLSCGAITN